MPGGLVILPKQNARRDARIGRRRLLLAALAGMGSSAAGAAMPQELQAGLAGCRALSDDAARLACYDRLTASTALVSFEGKGSRVTPPFRIASPSVMTFTNGDVVLVLYLLDAGGRVMQNFHQPGAGTGTFLIREPGEYSLQINATGSWHIQITPAAAKGAAPAGPGTGH